MLRMFGGMILGSMTTMLLLGGPTAADKILSNAKNTFHQQYTQPDPFMNFVLLLSLGFTLAILAVSRTRQTKHTERIVTKLRRHCS